VLDSKHDKMLARTLQTCGGKIGRSSATVNAEEVSAISCKKETVRGIEENKGGKVSVKSSHRLGG